MQLTKVILATFILLGILVACGQEGDKSEKGKWSEEAKKQYQQKCIKQFVQIYQEQGARKLCGCSLEKMEKLMLPTERDPSKYAEEITTITSSCAEGLREFLK